MLSRVFQRLRSHYPLIPGLQGKKRLYVSQHVGFRWYLWMGLWCTMLVAGVCGLVLITNYGAHGYNDFCQDYRSAVSLLHGQTLYPPVHCNLIYKYLPGHVEYNSHPPTSILLFVPFALLPKIPAAMLWGFISLAAYLVTGWLLLRELNWRMLPGLALFALASVFWIPSLQATYWLNMDQVLLLLLTGVWLLEQRRQDAWAGVVLGVAGLLKIWPLIILVIPLLQRRWRMVAATGCVVALGSLLALLVEGLAAFQAYWGPVRAIEQIWVLYGSVANVSVAGALVGLLEGYTITLYKPTPLLPGIKPGMAVLLGEGLSAGLLGGGMWLLWWKRQSLQDEASKSLALGLVVTLILLTFPLTWSENIITLLLPITILLLALRQLPRPPRWWWGLLGASLLLLNIPYVPYTAWLIGQVLQCIWNHRLVVRALEILEGTCPTLGLLLFAGAQAFLFTRQKRAEPVADQPPRNREPASNRAAENVIIHR